MDKFNKFLSFFLVLCFLLPTLPSYALVDAEGDEISIPENPPGTPVGVQCTGIDEKPGKAGVCCVGLTLNSAGICDEPVYSDPALVSCSSDDSCTDGTACFPQSGSDLFSSASPSKEDADDLSAARSMVSAQISDAESIKENGRACAHSRECTSYSCVSGVCQEKLVCRFAKEGELAPGAVKCAGNLVKGAGGKCELSPDAQNQIYIGLLNEAKITQPDQTRMCHYELDETTRVKALAAMRSLRAMEWLFATANLSQSEDCFQIVPVLKSEIGNSFLTTRKTILANFNVVYAGIEKDYKTLIDAKTADPTKIVTVHNGENISNADLYSRQTSGIDNLLMLYRRNILFKDYESAMLKTVDSANNRLTSLAAGMATWTSGASSWSLGDKVVNGFNCEGSKYKVKKFLSWKTKYYGQIKDRWANYYEVTGNADLNSDIVKRTEVLNTLGLMSGMKPEDAATEFTKQKYYLIDPLMFSNLKNGAYGQSKPLKSKSSFLGLFGGFKDLRKAYYLKGDSVGSYTKMYADLKTGLTDFYRTLKPGTLDPSVKGFVYEPELMTTEAKDCIDPSGTPTPACSKFGSFLEGIQDETFGHFLAYAYSNQDSYDGYFENATSYRRRLLAKLQVDMQNISKYYEKVIQTRDLQNDCIKALAKDLDNTKVLASGDDITKGVVEGPSSSVLPPGTVGALPSGTTSGELAANTISKFVPASFSYDLTANNLKDMQSVSGKNASTLTSGSSGAKSGSVTTSMAANMAYNKMTSANLKAKSKGVNTSSKESAAAGILDSMKASLASAAASPGSIPRSTVGKGTGFNPGSVGKATVGEDTAPKDSVNSDSTSSHEVSESTATNMTSSTKSLLSGIEPGSDSAATGSAGALTDKDHSGLSDQDKDHLMSAYEKNRNEYEGSEEDGIFKKVSKAYVRNLDKVLSKKKKID